MTKFYVKYYDLTSSIRKHIMDVKGIKTDIVGDGYEFPADRPLVTIELMPINNEYNVKRREAVEVTYRWQIGVHASNVVEQMKLKDEFNDFFMFTQVPYFDFERSRDESQGFVELKVTSATPMPSDDIAKASKRYTTYFDVEIETIKRRC